MEGLRMKKLVRSVDKKSVSKPKNVKVNPVVRKRSKQNKELSNFVEERENLNKRLNELNNSIDELLQNDDIHEPSISEELHDELYQNRKIELNEKIFDKIVNYIYDNRDMEMIYIGYNDELEDLVDYIILAKNICLNVNRANNNNTFQPYEKTQKENHCMVYIVELISGAREQPSIAKRLKRINCPVIRINTSGEVEDRLREI